MSNGHFVWHDLYSTDPAAARNFYSELLGWSIHEQDMGGQGPYAVIHAGEAQIGGINALMPNHSASNWISYISVDDVSAASSAVTTAGGTIYTPAFAVPGIGTMAFVRDPWGAAFSPFQDENPGNILTPPSGNPAPGSPAWHELVTSDDAAAVAFYAGLTGWNHVVWDMGGFSYNGMLIGEIPAAGIFQGEPGAPSTWTIYFETNGSLTDAIAAVTRLGGTLVGDRTAVEGTGEFQLVQDPTGAQFGLLESEKMA